MDCAAFRADAGAYVDGELPVAALAERHRHVEGCADCAALVARYRRLGELVREAAPSAPPSLRRRALALTSRRRRWPHAIAAAALVAAALTWSARTEPPGLDADDVREVVALHARARQPGHLVDLASGAPATVRPWLRERLGFAPPIAPVLAGADLVGARLDWCDQRDAAVLVYRRDGHLIELIAYPADGPGEVGTARSDGLALRGWVANGLQLVLVSDLPLDELDRSARALAERS